MADLRCSGTFHSANRVASPRRWLRCPSRTLLKFYCHSLQTIHFGEMTSPSCPLPSSLDQDFQLGVDFLAL